MDNVLVIAALIAIALLFSSFAPLRPRQRNPAKSATPPPPLPSAEEPHEVKNAEKAGAQCELNEANDAVTNEIGAIQDHLAKARDLVSKSEVDSAACDIIAMIQYWPKVLEANNGQPPLPFRRMEEGRMPAQRNSERDGRWVSWLSNGVPYRLELWMSPNNSSAFDDDLDIGDLRLWVDGESVMELNVLKRAEAQHDRCTAFGVSSLRAGSWMLRLNELAAQLRVAESERSKT
jgi:hypothetical protein